MNIKHSHAYPRIIVAMALALVTLCASAAPNPLPPQANAYGKGYATYGARWMEWAFAIPASTSPFLDTDGSYATIGQSGKVWFLAGNFGGTSERWITVPTGTALFFPIVNAMWTNTPEYGDAAWSDEQEAYAREAVAALADTTEGLMLEIDGRAVANIYDYRVASKVGYCNFPEDNVYGVPLDPVPHECLADGYWALLPPMHVGEHTIHFAGGFAGSEFALDVTYHVNVVPRHKAGEAETSLHP